MNPDDMLEELYLLVEREDAGETLDDLERGRYVELCDMLRYLNINIPFGISV